MNPTAQKDKTQIVVRDIMRDCWMEGFSVKAIAKYFGLKPNTVYDKISLKAFRKKAENL